MENDGLHRGKAAGSRLLFPSRFADRFTWAVVAIIAVSYFFGLTPGHVFVQDDFAAYLMHAANLVEHRPYTTIRYVPNPQAPWVSPANGYPPVYPLLLAPVYWQRGFDLRAMKIITACTFAGFLVAFAKWVQPLVSPKLRVIAVVLVGLNPAFWSYRDLISSEFPYLMISFLTLLAIRRAYVKVDAGRCPAGWALLVAIALYAAYGTRTIGIALAIATVLTDLVKFRWPSRFLCLVLGLLAALLILQAGLIISPKGYVSLAHVSARSIFGNVWFYAKSLSYTWQNGFSKPAQVLLAFVLTGFAGLAFARCSVREGSAAQFYVLVYLAILVAWGAQIGIRGLMPILPVYLTYVLLGIGDVAERVLPRMAAHALVVGIAVCVVISYVGALRLPPWQASLANVRDASAQELFSFLRSHTAPSDLLVFSKPRSIALYTNRPTTSLGPHESAGDAADFLRDSGAKFLIETAWNPPSYERWLASNPGSAIEVFRNRDFRVLQIRLENRSQLANPH